MQLCFSMYVHSMLRTLLQKILLFKNDFYGDFTPSWGMQCNFLTGVCDLIYVRFATNVQRVHLNIEDLT